jgi:hypothetical protein
MKKGRTKHAMVIVLALGSAAAACLDMTPINDVPVVAGDAGIDVLVSSATAANTCFQCSSGAAEVGPSCKDEYAACVADPKCFSLFVCGIPRGCYAPGTDLVECLTACGIAAGLSGVSDPAVPPFLALHGCATTSCAAACASSP